MVLIERRVLSPSQSARFQQWDEDFNRNSDELTKNIAINLVAEVFSNFLEGMQQLQTSDDSLHDETCRIVTKLSFDITQPDLFTRLKKLTPEVVNLSPFKDWNAAFFLETDEVDREHIRGIMNSLRKHCEKNLLVYIFLAKRRDEILARLPHQIISGQEPDMPLSITFTFKRADIQIDPNEIARYRQAQRTQCYDKCLMITAMVTSSIFLGHCVAYCFGYFH